MTGFTTISNALVEVGAKPFASTIQALRDNPIAIAEADATVPLNLLPTVLLGTIVTTSGSTQTLSGLVLTPFKWLRLVFVGVSGTLAGNLRVDGVTVSPIGGVATSRGFVDIDLTDGTFIGILVEAGTNASAFGGAVAGDTSITTASTSVAVSVSAGAFDAGAVRVFGMK